MTNILSGFRGIRAAIFSGITLFVIGACLMSTVALASYVTTLYGTPAIHLRSSDANFYGVDCSGGIQSAGKVIKVAPSGSTSTVYSFPGVANDICPNILVQGSDGNFYGTTRGSNNIPTIFKLTPSGSLTTLYTFPVNNLPNILVQGSDGNFYGTAFGGGNNNSICSSLGCGTIFKISPSGAFTNLHNFSGTDGYVLGFVNLLQGSDGNFYGTTSYGGNSSSSCSTGCGTVFKITPSGVFSSLYLFSSSGGSEPSYFIQGNDGNFYGTTPYGPGGSAGDGTIFKISSSGAFTNLHNFSGVDGSRPSGINQGNDGNFYGTASSGGNSLCPLGCGTIFKISPSGTFSTMYLFLGGSDGQNPSSPITHGSDGNLYGTTAGSGAVSDSICPTSADCGTIFKLSPSGTMTPLYRFNGSTKPWLGAPTPPSVPTGSIYLDSGPSSIYGGTNYGGTNGRGVFYQLSVTPSTGADLSLSVNGTETASGLASYNVTVNNAGAVSATGVIVNALIPTGTTFVPGSSTPACAQSGTTINCAIGTVTSGAAASAIIAFQSQPVASVTGSFLVISNVSDPNTSNNTAVLKVVPPIADLSVGGTASQTPTGLFVFDLIVGNAGPVNATGVVVTATIPSGTTFVPNSSSSGCTVAGQTITCGLGTVAKGALTTVTISLQSNTQPSITFSVAANESDPNSANNSVNGNSLFSDFSDGDIPTLPEWGAILMGLLLLVSVARRNMKSYRI